jgi:transposase
VRTDDQYQNGFLADRGHVSFSAGRSPRGTLTAGGPRPEGPVVDLAAATGAPPMTAQKPYEHEVDARGSAQRLAAAQQGLARKKRGSTRRKEAAALIARLHGKVRHQRSPHHTSQRCAECGHVAAGNRVTQAEFRCLGCGHQAHADVNAGRNILRAGLALQEA